MAGGQRRGARPKTHYQCGFKLYEQSNHLGNVLVTLTDKQRGIDAGSNGSLDYYLATVQTATHYYPFGWELVGMQYGAGYRYGFNGKEQDGETKTTDFGARFYDERGIRWWQTDRLSYKYPYLSSYAYVGNNPIKNIEIDGAYFVDADGGRVNYTVEEGKVILGENAPPDLREIVSLMNESGSKTALMVFEKAAKNDTKINVRIVNEISPTPESLGFKEGSPYPSKSAAEYHAPHDKEGNPLSWDFENKKFIGEPEYIDTKKGKGYEEVTIFLFKGNMKSGQYFVEGENGGGTYKYYPDALGVLYKGQTFDRLPSINEGLVATFTHALVHDTYLPDLMSIYMAIKNDKKNFSNPEEQPNAIHNVVLQEMETHQRKQEKQLKKTKKTDRP